MCVVSLERYVAVLFLLITATFKVSWISFKYLQTAPSGVSISPTSPYAVLSTHWCHSYTFNKSVENAF